MASFFECPAALDCEVDGAAKVRKIRIGLVFDLHIAFFLVLRALFTALV
jgi:hypothetical protein